MENEEIYLKVDEVFLEVKDLVVGKSYLFTNSKLEVTFLGTSSSRYGSNKHVCYFLPNKEEEKNHYSLSANFDGYKCWRFATSVVDSYGRLRNVEDNTQELFEKVLQLIININGKIKSC